MRRIFVTGIGIITPIGIGAEANRNSLANNICGIGQMNFTESKYTTSLPFGEIKLDNQKLASLGNTSLKGITRTTLLSCVAFQEAINHSSLNSEILRHYKTALIGASTVGGMCLTDQLYQDANSQDVGSDYLAAYDASSAALHLQKQFQIGGIVNTFNTACSSSANAIMYGGRLIQHGLADRALVGGADSLAKFTINGFNALRILSKNACTPFDESRSGLNLGEGAAFLVLEAEDKVGDKKVLAELTGFSNTNDAHHPTALSHNGDGPYLAMHQALQQAQLQPKDINFINTHGTGTENNDLVESIAMKRVFGNMPLFTSTKANTGHTLGAASAVEAVYSILNIVYQEIYGHLNFLNPIAETGLTPNLQYAQKEISHVMSNSFGFGGNCSSLIFSKV